MTQHIWEQRYSRSHVATFNYDNWLEKWKGLLDAAQPHRGLDLGCGTGFDTIFMKELGLDVVSGDFSWNAVWRLVQHCASASVLQCDFAHGLPFRSQVFGVIIANLSLHYFPVPQMRSILRAIQACLSLHGHLLARFNSVNDIYFGAPAGISGGTAISQDGMCKVFYDQATLLSIFKDQWQIISLAEYESHCYGQPKSLLEIVVKNLAVE